MKHLTKPTLLLPTPFENQNDSSLFPNIINCLWIFPMDRFSRHGNCGPSFERVPGINCRIQAAYPNWPRRRDRPYGRQFVQLPADGPHAAPDAATPAQPAFRPRSLASAARFPFAVGSLSSAPTTATAVANPKSCSATFLPATYPRYVSTKSLKNAPIILALR